MNTKKIIQFIFLILFFTLLSCNKQNETFDNICKTGDLELAYEFKSKYPNTHYNIDSIIHKLEYVNLQNERNIPELIQFMDKYPNSNYRDTVQMLLYAVEWEKCSQSLNDENVMRYIEKYPKSPFTPLAEKWLNENAFNADNGIFFDKRNGKRYNWHRIDNLIWMSINIDIRGSDINDYNPTRDNEEVAKNLCPDGWHIPNLYEWIKSIEYSTGEKYFENSGSFKNDNFLEKLIGDKSNSFIERNDQKFLTSPIPSWSRKEFGYISISKAYGYFDFSSRIYNGDKISIICVKDYIAEEVFRPENYAIDLDGNIYRTIKAGNKTWFYDDLNTTRFSNGDFIQDFSDIKCDNDRKLIYQTDAYHSGKLYSGYTVNDSRGLCPSGWHVPTSNEWKELFGDTAIQCYANSFIACSYPNVDSNPPYVYFWCSDRNYIFNNQITKTYYYNSGYSVRCVKD